MDVVLKLENRFGRYPVCVVSILVLMDVVLKPDFRVVAWWIFCVFQSLF